MDLHERLSRLATRFDVCLENTRRRIGFVPACVHVDVDQEDASAVRQVVKALDDWRSWAQFVCLGGGPVTATDAVLREAVCETHDSETLAVAQAAEAACDRELQRAGKVIRTHRVVEWFLEREIAALRRNRKAAADGGRRARARRVLVISVALERAQHHAQQGDMASAYRVLEQQIEQQLADQRPNVIKGDELTGSATTGQSGG